MVGLLLKLPVTPSVTLLNRKPAGPTSFTKLALTLAFVFSE
jgi:hypothetical protein